MSITDPQGQDRLQLDESHQPTTHIFTQDEVNTMWRIIKHQYVHYDDEPAMKLALRIGKITTEK